MWETSNVDTKPSIIFMDVNKAGSFKAKAKARSLKAKTKAKARDQG